MQQNKYLEYYLDSKIYTNEEVQKSIEATKKEFPNKKVKANIKLNEFGVYIITCKFESKDTYFNKIKIWLWKKIKKPLLLEKGKENRRYGQYKATKNYRPY